MLCNYFIYFIYLIFLSFMLFSLGLKFLMENLSLILEWELISINSNMIVMIIILDWISLMFMGLVLLISSMVVYYMKSYMSEEVYQIRFLFLVLLFILSMLLMIMSPNLISILLGWDGLGFVSYCLIIYYQNVKSSNSGMLTVLMNRGGDAMILMAIVWMMNYGSWNFMFYNFMMQFDYEMSLICFLVFMGAITKSAQIPFSPWLPAAMAAPTPVSALVHSSTLVTAGVYMLIRFMSLLENSFILKILFVLSVLTMLMSGIAANYEFDLKKIIALSTLSQLGLMMSILSLNFKILCFFHLMTHALFKSMLFMCAGMMIHMMGNNQDIRCMGNLINYSPLLGVNFNIGNLALCGMPFLAGFYSKDLMGEMFLFFKFNILIFFFFFFSIGLTVSYTLRLMMYTIFYQVNYYPLGTIYDDYKMLSSMLILMFFSLVGGSLLGWLIFFNMMFIYLSQLFKFMIMIFIFIGLLMGNFMFKLKLILKNKLMMYMYMFISKMFFMPFLFTYGVSGFYIYFSKFMLKLMDLGWLEKFGAQGIYSEFMKISNLNQFMQLMNLKIYLMMFMIFMGLCLLI
uniref:NADH dehydrogenase subunit 5 n=1 Tax=Eoneureclipsis hainanensis TaxID=3043990 RepID=UPI002551CAB3|nr:NADH dehydrogenase subunit 5 [Eoneureclipsis hainanensis]WGT74389.1 NADH dehydrogenase subunit 5 [Eoneureclipsis hainanensis]